MTDRFAHHLRLDRIGDGERLDLTADEDERSAIARRLGLGALSCLEAHAVLSREGEIVRARGRLAAALEQSCVVTNEPVPAHIDEAFELVFMPEPEAGEERMRSSSAEAISTSCSTTARKSTLGRRSRIRSPSASTPIRAAQALRRR